MSLEIIRIHSSFHKCLTQYYMSVMTKLFNRNPFRRKPNYEHFESIEGLLYNRAHQYRLVSSNGFAIEPERFSKDYRITRFIRDPRDLIISGYFYHLKGSEPWFKMKNPTPEYWAAINGNIPERMPKNISYSEYLQSLSQEEGLLTEIKFRKFQLESMRKWPESDSKIKLFKYENIIGNEVDVFQEMFDFMELNSIEKKLGLKFVRDYALDGKRVKSVHIRNAISGQWRNLFTNKIERLFNDQYQDIIEHYNYEI